jgi:hypothetical protein
MKPAHDVVGVWLPLECTIASRISWAMCATYRCGSWGFYRRARLIFSLTRGTSQIKDEVLPSYKSMVKEIAEKIEDRLWNGD